MLQLKPITKDNWYEAVMLQVAEDQKNLVASNAISLAQLNFLENFHANAIYADETMVGFTLFGLDDEDKEYWIYRLMIDEKFQGMGYGKQSVALIVEAVRQMKEPQHQVIQISYEPKNVVAKHVYEKAGFSEIEGLFSGSEQIARYAFVGE